MIVNSKLVRFVKFGAVEIAPGMNELDEKQATELNAHKGFQSYIKIKDMEILEDEKQSSFNEEEFLGLHEDELAEKYSVKELKAFCKELGIKGYSSFTQTELLDAIFAHIEEG